MHAHVNEAMICSNVRCRAPIAWSVLLGRWFHTSTSMVFCNASEVGPIARPMLPL